MIRLDIWFVWLALGVLLVACGAVTDNEPAMAPVVDATAVSPPATTVSATAVVAEAPSSDTPPPIVIDEGAVISGDDRSSQLQALTSAWQTDWTRRTIDTGEILSGGPPRDGIPSIDDPQFVSFAEAEAWLAGNEPVIALEINGDARAYPLQIMTWHEIANDEVGGIPVVVTFCPLCNSALVFDRRLCDEVFDFGVSGLLRNSDLIMYDRTSESLWQQFTGEGIIGDYAGAQLTFLPSQLVSFDDFRAAYPDGVVLSRDTGFNRAYGRNPYAGYDTIDQPFLFRGPTDERLPAIARVVTVSLPEENIDVAYPLETLAAAGVINDRQGNTDLVVFHQPGTATALGAAEIAQGADVGATGVFVPAVDGQALTFRRDGERIVDEQTGSEWNVLGQAVDGALAGATLAPVVHGDHFWFSWAAFRPDTVIFGQ